MNTEYVNFYDYYIMSEEEPKKDAEINKKIITHLEKGTGDKKVLETYTLQDIFYVDDKFVYSSDIKLPDNYGAHYRGKHPLLLLKKEFLTKNTMTPLYRSDWTNAILSGYSDVITESIDNMIKLIQHLLQDEPNTQDESNRDFIQRFVEKRKDYTEKKYEEDKAQFKEDMEKTLEELKNQDNAEGYIRDIEGLLTGIYEPVSDEPVSDEPVSVKPVSVSKPEPKSKTRNSTSRTKMNEAKKSKSKSKKNTGKRRKRNQLQTVRRGAKRGPKKLFTRTNIRNINR